MAILECACIAIGSYNNSNINNNNDDDNNDNKSRNNKKKIIIIIIADRLGLCDRTYKGCCTQRERRKMSRNEYLRRSTSNA